MNPRLHDDAVADLPLSTARAELLEEIMSTPVLDRPRPDTGTPGRRRWLVPVAAAATVAGLLVVPSYLLTRGDGAREAGAPASSSSASASPTVPASRDWVVLEADGWTVTYVADSYGEREVQYDKGDASLAVHLRPARAHTGYVEDRRRIGAPDVDPGTPVQLLGTDALMWPYSATDHTAIGTVTGTVFPEVRGDGMGRSAYLELLDQLAWTDEAGFEATLPEEFVTTSEQDAEVAAMMGGIAVPAGFEMPAIEEKDPYQLGARVSGAVACEWLDLFAAARKSGDDEGMRRAAGALADSRRWEVLHQMNAEGDYPEVIWEYADEVRAGRVPEGYRGGLGCP